MVLEKLVGKKVKRVFFNEDNLKFETEDGNFTYGVEGDCCSSSYFYDFYGVKNLLNNGAITEVKEVDLHPDDIAKTKGDWSTEKDRKYEDDSIQVYGYQLTTISPEFGEVTSVVSFRNYSNGYYGGWMEEVSDREVLPEIFDDVIETENK